MENFFPKLTINKDKNLSNNFLLQQVYEQINFNWDSLDIVYDESQKIVGASIHQSSIQNIIINKTPIFVWKMSIIKEVIKNTQIEIYSNSELIYS